MPEDVTETKQDAESERDSSTASSSETGAAASTSPAGAAAAESSDSAEQDEASEQPEAAPDPLETALEESKRLKDQLLRTAADYDNFRKRTKRELTEATERGREELLKELLPVFDNLERAVEHAKSATDMAALADGIDLVIKQFVDTLSRLGIEKIDALGEVFDPSVHEAIQQLETTEVPAGSVASQVQAGYKVGGRLMRPCMVVVAKAPVGD